jgi:hypothetical protein
MRDLACAKLPRLRVALGIAVATFGLTGCELDQTVFGDSTHAAGSSS